ncbi:hypothetical protein P3553_12035 [Vibrio parahaemolyticus]|uniref:hypothetical protein n=1 Tax=Vibrio parahaemolyticus TaxID=670 RepID=UPI000A36706B|nr:hypothetical protein [Vibrio parahaemolyticus]ELA9373351.1 hypothetical protein [Vibrio parahaemolyticus]MBO0170309.1 hypothetical protein [Vibrio parahaemolyticus]MDF4755664.1 hypothetical protein [Vibrio parahaemolyticus]MDF4781893.1 hypothetical protein [Vibrio parahaemolyticus]MDF4786720.1 hypothetical protein [Vibrio parahaemolyticus]
MKEEGYFNRVIQIIDREQLSGSDLANQNLFNGPDSEDIGRDLKATIIFSLVALNKSKEIAQSIDSHIDEAHKASTLGDFKRIISEVSNLMQP